MGFWALFTLRYPPLLAPVVAVSGWQAAEVVTSSPTLSLMLMALTVGALSSWNSLTQWSLARPLVMSPHKGQAALRGSL